MKFVSDIKKADVILLGLPVDQGTENKGCIDAPAKVRAAFDNFYFSESAVEKKIFDASDVVEEKNFGKTMQKIENKVSELLKHKKPIVSIGGNHSVTVPVVSAFSKYYKKLGIVFIDAHPDCHSGYFPFGDVVTKIVRQKIPTVLIGIRNWSKEEYEFLKKHKIPFLQAKDFSLAKATALIKKHLQAKQIYISLDIDAIDPAFAPGTGCIEPGGLTNRDVLSLLYIIGAKFKVFGLDIVEINPSKDFNNLTTNLGAKLILEFVDKK
jgi:agmatinase